MTDRSCDHQSPRDRDVYSHIWSTEPDHPPSDTVVNVVGMLTREGAARGHAPDAIRFLDLASGSGRHSAYAARAGLSVTSVEYDNVGVKRQESLGIDIELVCADVRTWVPRQEHAAWDGIVIVDALHHMYPSLERVVTLASQIRRLVRPGGLFLATLLCNISYSAGEVPSGRLRITTDQGEDALMSLFASDEVLVVKQKHVHVPSTHTWNARGDTVETTYDSDRVLVLARRKAE